MAFLCTIFAMTGWASGDLKRAAEYGVFIPYNKSHSANSSASSIALINSLSLMGLVR